MRIAVIDSGINRENKKINFYKKVKISVNESNVVEVTDDDVYDCSNHANIILNILERYLKENDDVLFIKVLNEELKTHSFLVVEAIRYAVSHNVDIINLSLGTQNEKHENEMYQAIKEAEEKGIIIVTASNNDGKITIPSKFSEVITVKPKNCYFDEQYWEFDEKTKEITAGNKQWIYYDIYGTSYVAPHVVGVIAGIMRDREKKERKEVFRIMAESYCSYVKSWHE